MRTKFTKRKGLDGPFTYVNGRVLYFDRKEGQYWDPMTDFYVEDTEVHAMQQELFELLGRE